MRPPLSGLRVVEMTTMITGPLAGMMLADLGADVIKVERPDGGDPFRSFRGGLYSPHFCAYNRNKRSIVLDVRAQDDLRALRELLARSDVLLENFRPGVLDRLNLVEGRLHDLNPRLIHCSITGFGPTGPYAYRPAYDAVAQAVSGMSSLFMDRDDPAIVGPTIVDNVTAHTACQGILAAVLSRGRGDPVRRVEVNMLDAAVAFIPDPFGYLHQMGIVSDERLRARTSQSYAFACGDGKLLAVHLSSQEKFWDAFVTALNRPDLLSDPRFSSRMQRIEHYGDLHAAVAADFRREPRSAWLGRLADADLPVAPVHDVSAVADDPQIRHLDTFVQLHHPTEGAITAIRRPIRLDGTRDDQPRMAPPTLGEHTEEILRELDLPHRPA
jgi:formyl-CoA transferase